MLVNLSKSFLQVNHFSSFEIKHKYMIVVLGGTGSRERKLLKFKWSSNISAQDTKAASNDKCLV